MSICHRSDGNCARRAGSYPDQFREWGNEGTGSYGAGNRLASSFGTWQSRRTKPPNFSILQMIVSHVRSILRASQKRNFTKQWLVTILSISWLCWGRITVREAKKIAITITVFYHNNIFIQQFALTYALAHSTISHSKESHASGAAVAGGAGVVVVTTLQK